MLQHPEEAGSAKSTVTLMQLCLADCRVVTGRKFRQVPVIQTRAHCDLASGLLLRAVSNDVHPQTDLPADLLAAADQGQRARSGIRDAATARWQRTLLLWPSPDSEALESVAASLNLGRAQQVAVEGGTGSDETQSCDDYVLLVLLDGTWPSCGQMLQKSVISLAVARFD